MPTISKNECEEYKKLCYDRDHGRFLTSDGLHLICKSYNNPEAIGKHMLEALARIERSIKNGIISKRPSRCYRTVSV